MDHQSLRAVILRKLDDGSLPLDRPIKLLMRYGSQRPCAACGEPLLPAQVEYELTYAEGRPAYRMHLGCAGLWEALRLKRGLDPVF
jgi:hypothetical protein